MKVINYVHIQNMYAHKDTKLEFTDGKNYIIGPIGSGKTEVLQAIGFAFFRPGPIPISRPRGSSRPRFFGLSSPVRCWQRWYRPTPAPRRPGGGPPGGI